jgi:HK97 family phage portal protein
MVEACVSAYSQTVAMCPGDHWRSTGDGGRERVTTSALSRIIRQPNDYQSMSDLLLNVTRRLYERGEAFALAPRDGSFQIKELHWMRDGWPLIAEDGSIFYQLHGNEIAERRYDLSEPVPARDVLHVRLHTPSKTLRGVSPILNVALELEMSGAALSQQAAFYINEARPSIILETDQQLTVEQSKDLRKRWDEQTQGEHAGGTPILSWGLKAKPVTIGAGDARLADMLRLTNENVALAFRMPLQILGIGGTPFASTEALMSSWKAMGLGFALNHIEETIGRLFNLAGYPNEYVEFDTNALLRSSFKEMIEALSIGTRRLMKFNEARRFLDLPEVEGGDELYVQMQDIPLSMAGKMTAATPAQPQLQPPARDAANDGERADAESLVRAFRAGRNRALAA